MSIKGLLGSAKSIAGQKAKEIAKNVALGSIGITPRRNYKGAPPGESISDQSLLSTISSVSSGMMGDSSNKAPVRSPALNQIVSKHQSAISALPSLSQPFNDRALDTQIQFDEDDFRLVNSNFIIIGQELASIGRDVSVLGKHVENTNKATNKAFQEVTHEISRVYRNLEIHHRRFSEMSKRVDAMERRITANYSGAEGAGQYSMSTPGARPPPAAFAGPNPYASTPPPPANAGWGSTAGAAGAGMMAGRAAATGMAGRAAAGAGASWGSRALAFGARALPFARFLPGIGLAATAGWAAWEAKKYFDSAAGVPSESQWDEWKDQSNKPTQLSQVTGTPSTFLPDRHEQEKQKSQFMKFGELPPGFEFLPGHKGMLGQPEAVAARGVMPLGGYAGSGGAPGAPMGGYGGGGGSWSGGGGGASTGYGTSGPSNDQPSAKPFTGNQKEAYDKMYDAARKAGSPDPHLTASIAMMESGWLKSSMSRRANNPFGQTVTQKQASSGAHGLTGGTKGADGQLHGVYTDYEAAVKHHLDKWGKYYVPGDAAQSTANLREAGYNTANPEWAPGINQIYRKHSATVKQAADEKGLTRSTISDEANKNRPVNIKGKLTFPELTNEKGEKYRPSFDVASGGRAGYSSVPYGIHDMSGLRPSGPVISRAYGRQSVVQVGDKSSDYQRMYDPKGNKIRTEIQIHSTNDVETLISKGCIVVPKSRHKEFVREYGKAIEQYGSLYLAVSPSEEGQGHAVFDILTPEQYEASSKTGKVITADQAAQNFEQKGHVNPGDTPQTNPGAVLLDRVRGLRVKGADMSKIEGLGDLQKKGGQAFGGGKTNEATLALATLIQEHAGEDLIYFSGFNDYHHQKSKSHHAKGRALDVTFKSGSKGTVAAIEKVKEWAEEAGIDPRSLELGDEYKKKSANWTGGHGHFAFRNDKDAAKFLQWFNEKYGATQVEQTQQQLPGMRSAGDIQAELMREAGMNERGGAPGIASSVMESTPDIERRYKENEAEKQDERVAAYQQQKRNEAALGVSEGTPIEKGRRNAAGAKGGIVSEDTVKAQVASPKGGIVTREEKAPPPPPKESPREREAPRFARDDEAKAAGAEVPEEEGGKKSGDKSGSGRTSESRGDPVWSGGRNNPESQASEPGSGGYGSYGRCFV